VPGALESPTQKRRGSFLHLHLKGHAIRALLHAGVGLMSADHNFLQRAVGLGDAVIFALGDGALNALVGLGTIAILHWISLHFI